MNRRLHQFVLDNKTYEIPLLDDETFDLAALKPYKEMSRVASIPALVSLAGLQHGTPSRELGLRGPLVASRANAENSHDESANKYNAYFGRDGLMMALMLSDRYPQLLSRTVMFFARHQGREDNEFTHEQLGRIVHEMRKQHDDQGREVGLNDLRDADFGSRDATPLWIVAACRAIELDPKFANATVEHISGDVTTIKHCLGLAVDLLDTWRAANPQGLIEAGTEAGGGQTFPFWKDSPDAYHHVDGNLASPFVSSVEVMGYAVAAYKRLSGVAWTHESLGYNARTLFDSAMQTKEAVFEHFWLHEQQMFAMGTDRDPNTGVNHDPVTESVRPLSVVASNMGHLGAFGFYDSTDDFYDLSEVEQGVITKLFSKEMLCHAGIRTLASNEVRFRETSYHNGSVWPWETAAIGCGLEANYPRLAMVLYGCVARSCNGFLPEFVPGNDDKNPRPGELVVRVDTVDANGHRINRHAVEAPQPMQGWTAAALAHSKLRTPALAKAIKNLDTTTPEFEFEQSLLNQLVERGIDLSPSFENTLQSPTLGL